MTRLHRSPRRSAAARGATLALSLLLAACGDNSTGPAPRKPVDPLATAANIQDLAETFSVPVFQSLGLASQYSPAGTSAFGTLRTVLRAAPPAIGAGHVPSTAERRLTASAIRAALVPPSGPISAAILPPEVLGKTFEWDAVGFGGYIVTDRHDPDAPTNG